MDLRDVLHQLVDCSAMRWQDEDGKRSGDAHEAIDRYFVHPAPDSQPAPRTRAAKAKP
jgi:hypothetical protein